MAATTAWNLDRFRPLLHLQVRLLGLDSRFRRRFDSSDLVQETLLRAHENREQFRGASEAELVRWLQEILRNTAVNKVREATAGKRDLRLEASLQQAVAESSARLQDCLHARGPAPDEQVERQELLPRLAAALDQLPPDQRDVVIQRDLCGDPVRQIAEQLGRTEKAVAGLLLRGRRKLAELLSDFR
jgi:RNA polymerase sigma-70 factor (ECF subfamily)